MMRNFYRRNRLHQGLLLVVAAVAAYHCSSQVVAQETLRGPAITRIEVGFKNHYKLGFWTPVLVEVAGVDGEQDKDLRVCVTAFDSDGVPTMASAPVPSSNGSSGNRSATVY